MLTRPTTSTLFPYTTLFRSLTWHFTVDDHSIYQSLPTNETGEHADYEGEGNRMLSGLDRKSTRLNSSHVAISYAVFCLKKKNNERKPTLKAYRKLLNNPYSG